MKPVASAAIIRILSSLVGAMREIRAIPWLSATKENSPFSSYGTSGRIKAQKPALSILEGGIQAPGWGNAKADSIAKMYYDALAKKYHFKLTTPIKDLPRAAMDALMYGTNGEPLELQYETARGTGTLRQPFEGLANSVERRYRETQSQSMREEYEQYLGEYPCPDCGGKRLKKEALAVTVGGLNIAQDMVLPMRRWKQENPEQ